MENRINERSPPAPQPANPEYVTLQQELKHLPKWANRLQMGFSKKKKKVEGRFSNQYMGGNSGLSTVKQLPFVMHLSETLIC